MSLVRSLSSLSYLIPTTYEPYANLRHFGPSDLQLNLIVLVLQSLRISFPVERIHLILYLNMVMIS
jgi:hypothetical protein